MKLKVILFVLVIPGLSACVTTRSELNQKREAASDPVVPTVKSEEIKKPVAPEPLPVLAAGSSKDAKTDPTTLSEDELRVELAQANGRVEELQHEKELSEKASSEELKKAQDRIAGLEKQLKELTPETVSVPEGKTPFEAGKDAYLAGKFDESLVFFSQFLSGQESGKEVEEATFLRGEAYFKKLQYNKAILDYSKFPEKFRKSSFHPKALLRIAECFEATGRKDDAKVFYSDLVEKFPKTAEGKVAKKKMKK
jgi:TolA-binding protein